VFPYLIVQMGTLDLGHELTYFGKLSQPQGAYVRYTLLLIPVILFAAGVFRFSRRKPSTTL
jgi:hypothetical protein